MTMTATGPDLREIVVEDVLPHDPATVWRILTNSDLMARWLMPNDFRAELGARFTFRTKPMPGWDGVVHCAVTAIEPERLLAYSWQGGDAETGLNTLVTWSLIPVEAGTRLRMVHSGFRLPKDEMALAAMTPGWERVPGRIADLAGEAVPA